MAKLKKLLSCLVLLAFLVVLAAGGLLGYLYFNYGRDLPDISKLEDYQPAQTTRILSTDGVVIGTLFEENRVWKPLSEISPKMVKALLAVEDSRFYEHPGADPVGLLRAVFNALTTGEVREGASTITMQLARGLFLTNEPTMERKCKEIFLALELERRYTKDKILETYLNHVYYGSGAYGIHSAARLYFNRTADDLSYAQAALLAGLLQAPTRFSPLESPERARVRQGEVLERMKANGFLSDSQWQSALEEADNMKFTGTKKRSFEVLKYPYFTGYVIKELSERYSPELLYRGGLTVSTTLDTRLQTEAEAAVKEEVTKLSRVLNVDNGALVLVENETGYIRALVGGVGWTQEDQFNRAWQSKRQPGSSFKAVVYAAALESGYSPESKIEDRSTSYQDGSGRLWTPKNSDGRHLGVITLRQALAGSRNVPAVKLLSRVGTRAVIRLAYRMGIRSPIPSNLSIALGAVDASPLEMSQVFSIIANEGIDRRPVVIKQVADGEGRVLEESQTRKENRILTAEVATAMTSMLSEVVNSGTGRGAQIPGIPTAGKTGTTDNFRDAWFCGFTPYYTLAVWVGNDDNTPMWRSYGGDLPALIFKRLMVVAHQGKKSRDFPTYRPKKETVDVGAVASPTPVVVSTPTPEVETTPDAPLEGAGLPLEPEEPPPLPEEIDIYEHVEPPPAQTPVEDPPQPEEVWLEPLEE